MGKKGILSLVIIASLFSYFHFISSWADNDYNNAKTEQGDFFINPTPEQQGYGYPSPGTGLASNKSITVEQLSQADLASAQIKLTYHGPQNKPVKTFIIVHESGSFEVEKFRAANLLYGNDELPHNTRVFITGDDKLKNLMALLSEIPASNLNWNGTSISLYLQTSNTQYTNYYFVHKEMSAKVRQGMIEIMKDKDFTQAIMNNYNPLLPFSASNQ